MATLYDHLAAYEAQARMVEARLDAHDDELDELHSRMESVEEVSRMFPELLERLGPQTLIPAHQQFVRSAVKRLHDLTGVGYASIYTDLGEAFQVAKYGDIPESVWPQVEAWLNARILTAKTRG